MKQKSSGGLLFRESEIFLAGDWLPERQNGGKVAVE